MATDNSISVATKISAKHRATDLVYNDDEPIRHCNNNKPGSSSQKTLIYQFKAMNRACFLELTSRFLSHPLTTLLSKVSISTALKKLPSMTKNFLKQTKKSLRLKDCRSDKFIHLP